MTPITILIDKEEKKPIEYPPGVVWYDPRSEPEIGFPQTVDWYDRSGGKKEIIKISQKPYPLSEKNGLAGDYCVEGFEKYAGIERKGSYDELSTNFFSPDSYRFRKAWDRFVGVYRRKALLLDFRPWAEISNPHTKPAERIRATLFRLCAEGNVDILWVPRLQSPAGKFRTGELIVHWLWTNIQEEIKHGSGIHS